MSESNQEQPVKQRPTKEEFGALRKDVTPLRRRAGEILGKAGLEGTPFKKARAGVTRELLERQRRADIDHVTGLPVRRLFEERLQEEAKRHHRYGHPLTMVIVDLNLLKEINTSGGLPAGDMALRAVAEALKTSKRDLDFAARYGGDEFAVLLVETPVKNVGVWWDRFINLIKDTPYTVSGGAAEVNPKDIAGTEKILSDAVFKAKEDGQHVANYLVTHSPD